MLRTFKKNSILWSATAVLVAMALPAAAQDGGETDFSREGPYLGLSGSFVGDLSSDNLRTSDTGGAEIRLGFRMVPQMAVEIGGDWAHLSGRNPWSTFVALKLYVMEILDEDNQGGRVQPYFVSTAGIISGDLGKSKDPSGSFKVGLGLDYWLTKDIAVVVQSAYNFNSGDASRYQTVTGSLGVNWRF